MAQRRRLARKPPLSSGLAFATVLACWLSLPIPARAQGTIAVTSVDALQATNSSKAVVTHVNTLNLVYESGGKVYFTRSIGGGPWAIGTVLSGTLPKARRPAVAAGPDGALAVAFLAASPGSTLLDLYYTHRPAGGAWSAPVQISTARDFSLAVEGQDAHLALADVFGVYYVKFTAAIPVSKFPDFVDGYSNCCASLNPQLPAIAVATLPGGKPRVYIAFGFTMDATKNDPKCCSESGFQSGVRVRSESGDPNHPWFSMFDDFRLLPSKPSSFAASVVSVSLAPASGDVFLAYSDQFCSVSGMACLAPPRDPALRTRLARYNAVQDKWSSVLLSSSDSEIVHTQSRPLTSGINLRLGRDSYDLGACQVEDYAWHGASITPTLLATVPIPDCKAHAHGVFFQHACGAACEVKAVYGSSGAPPTIRTAPACAPTGLPDLEISKLVTAPPSSFYPGGSFALAYEVRNLGSRSMPSTLARVSLVPQSGQPLPIGDRVVPRMAAGSAQTVNQTIELSPTLAPANYALRVAADATARICEGDELNNPATLALVKVTSPPACTFTACQLRETGVNSPTHPPPLRYWMDAGLRGCGAPPGTTYTWYRRNTIGSGAWGSPIQSGASNTLIASSPPFELWVRATPPGTASPCDATAIYRLSGPPALD